ncbi:MAG: hydrogenase maturation protein, partial [Hyphomicrobiaceae bacterium]
GLIAAKAERRARDEAARPLRQWREEELAAMHRSFYGFDQSYHVARYNFVRKVPKSRTPLTLARHRAIAGPRALRNAS